MGHREYQAMIEFLKENEAVKEFFNAGSVETRYDPVMDEIHFISIIDDSVVTCKVNRA